MSQTTHDKPFRLFVLGSLALALSACGGGGGSDSGGGGGGGGSTPPPSGSTYSLGGAVSGLAGSGLVVQDSDGTSAAITANGAFTLRTGLSSGASYAVSVKTQPTHPAQSCTVANGSGSIAGANVTNVTVTCTTNQFSVGGSVSGLTGSGLVLQNNGGDDLAVSADGSFTFANSLASGEAYSVSVKTQPSTPTQTCTVGNGSGSVSNANVSSVSVSCSTPITSLNAALVSAIGNSVGESLTQVADLIGTRLAYLKANLSPTLTEACPAFGSFAAGSVDYVWTDTNLSSQLDAGDTVVATFTNCYVPLLFGELDVSLTITLTADPQADFAAILSLIQFPLTGEQLDGDVDIKFTNNDEARTVEGHVGAGGLTILVNLAGQDDTVTVLSATGSKSIDYVNTNYSVNLTADYQSRVLGGRFALATTTPLAGLLDTYPLQGTEEFTGGVSTLRLTAVNAAENSSADAGLDASGSGSFTSLGTSLWSGSSKGFLWWEPRAGTATLGSSSYDIGTKADYTMHLMLADTDGVNVPDNVSVKMFFSGPVVSHNFVFQGQGGATDVLGDETINGGIVVVTPHSALQQGASYRLTTTDGVVHSDFSGVVEDPFSLDLTVAP